MIANTTLPDSALRAPHPSFQDLSPAARHLVTLSLKELRHDLPFYDVRGRKIIQDAREYLEAKQPEETCYKEYRRLQRIRALRNRLRALEKEAA